MKVHFKDYWKLINLREYPMAIWDAIASTLVVLLWVAILPFVPLVIPIINHMRGQREAQTWKDMHGDRCPPKVTWWVKYL